MNDIISYEVKIPLEWIELHTFLQSLHNDYINIQQGYFLEEYKNLLIGIDIFRAVKRKYDMDMLRAKHEGYQRTKPYNIKVNKLKIFWLYQYIEDSQLIQLYNLHTNILGRHITEFTKK